MGVAYRVKANIVLSLYALKVKVFFGAFRASRASIAVLLIYLLGFLPGISGFSITIAEMLARDGANIGLYVDVFAAAVSILFASVILFSLRGATAFGYEQNFIFTAPLRPVEFLVANTLANITFLLIFASPLIVLYALIALFLKLSPLQAAVILILSALLALSLMFLKTFFSVLRSMHSGAWLSALIVLVAFILILPSAGFFMDLPLKYSALPYPSTLFARMMIDIIIYGSPRPHDLAGFILFFTASLALFAVVSARNFFPFTMQVPLVSPFDVSARTQTIKMERGIKFFSKMSVPLRLGLESRSLMTFLMKKEIIRLMREGSLFTTILIYLIIFIVLVAMGARAGGPPSGVFLSIISVISVMLPMMFAENWRIFEAKNLWLVMSSGADIRPIVRATLYSLVVVCLTLPSAMIIPASIILGVNPLPALIVLISISIVGCSAALYVSVKFLRGGRRGMPSLLANWLSMLLTLFLVSPAYILTGLISTIGGGLIFDVSALLGIIVYSLLMARILAGLIERNIRAIEV